MWMSLHVRQWGGTHPHASSTAAALRISRLDVPRNWRAPQCLHRPIYTQMDSKRYMGGFKSKRTGAIYHHATTQTPRALKYAGGHARRHGLLSSFHAHHIIWIKGSASLLPQS